tara:strand:- start:47 stop:286 length:240 start_codon:yes stop_codon:yes gene_type:complete
MADVIGMSDVSSPDTGKGSKLKTGGINRRHNMPNKTKCKTGEVYNQKLKKCVKSKPLREQSVMAGGRERNVSKYYKGGK